MDSEITIGNYRDYLQWAVDESCRAIMYAHANMPSCALEHAEEARKWLARAVETKPGKAPAKDAA